MMLCDKLRETRVLRPLSERAVGVALDIDTATYCCKIEKGVMHPKREHLPIIAHIFEVDKADLLKQWLAERILSIAKEEEIAHEVLEISCGILETQDTRLNV